MKKSTQKSYLQNEFKRLIKDMKSKSNERTNLYKNNEMNYDEENLMKRSEN